MKLSSVKQAFVSLIETAGHSLKALEPSEGVDLMLTFYGGQPAEGCRDDGTGDTLLYQWGTYDWAKVTGLSSTSLDS